MTRGESRWSRLMGQSTATSLADAAVVAFDCDHQDDERGDEDGGDPCACGELGDEDDDEGDSGCNCSDAVDDHAAEGAWAARSFPMHHHSGLREREGEKGTDGEEWDEAIGDSSEDDQQEGGEADQREDAVGVEETAAADLEDVGQIVVHARWRG